MKQLRILGLALLALFALGALTASVSSAAEEGVLEPGNFTIKGGPAELKTLTPEEIKCKETAGTGVFLTEKEKDRHATGTFTFKGCTANGFKANTLTDAEGTIKANVLFLICLTESAILLFGVLVLVLEAPLHIEVPIIKNLILVKGAAIGSLTKAGQLKGKEFIVAFKEPDAEKRTECTIEGVKFKSSLEAVLGTKGPDVDAFETGEGTVTFAKEVEFMDK
jgi:hypothetical protein